MMCHLPSRLILTFLQPMKQKLLKLLQNPTTKAYLQTKLVAVVDAGEAFVKAT